MISIAVDLKVQYRGADSQSIAFIKRHHVDNIELKTTGGRIGKQLQVINLGYSGEEIDIFRLANIYVDNGLIPLFASYRSKKSSDSGNIDHLDEIEQLLAKLRLEFTHCTQDQISYDVKLALPKRILQKKLEVEAEGRTISVDDFEAESSDQTFVDSLIKSLNYWLKDISKVTYMDANFRIDSVLTEITFWKNRETALRNIEQQLETPEIRTVLGLLNKESSTGRHVLSFTQNINVVNELKKAQDFNMMLKDCPINDLISAKDLPSTQKAINDIFEYLKVFKKGTSYPIGRIMEMLEALSKDCSKRILKILEDYDLMTIENKKFMIIKEE